MVVVPISYRHALMKRIPRAEFLLQSELSVGKGLNLIQCEENG